MTALRAAVFAIAVWTTFPYLSWTFLAQVTSSQVTRPGQVTQPPRNFAIASRPQWCSKRHETFWIRYNDKYIHTTFIFLIFLYRWPKVRSFSWPPHYKSMEKTSSTSNSYQIYSNRSETCSIRLLLMTSVQLCKCDPLKGHLMSYNDAMRSMYLFAWNFWLDWDKDMGQVSNGSSIQGALNDMQHDLPRSTFKLYLRSKIEVEFKILKCHNF